MGNDCGSIACALDAMEKRAQKAEAELERCNERGRKLQTEFSVLASFVSWLAKHPDIGDSLTAVEREKEIQACAREFLDDVNGVNVENVHPDDWLRVTTESHCARCQRCQAYKKMADDEAKRHGEKAARYGAELEQIVSYLAHYDQDANHAWMVRRIRAVFAGKNPSEVAGWTEHDGVPEPAEPPTKVLGTSYPPPKQLWFHFHPTPTVVAPDGEIRRAASGDLWHDPFESEDEARAQLGESAADGWVVVGPYTYEGKVGQ